MLEARSFFKPRDSCLRGAGGHGAGEVAQVSGRGPVTTYSLRSQSSSKARGRRAETDGLWQGGGQTFPAALHNNDKICEDFIILGTKQTPTAPSPEDFETEGEGNPHFPRLGKGIKNKINEQTKKKQTHR